MTMSSENDCLPSDGPTSNPSSKTATALNVPAEPYFDCDPYNPEQMADVQRWHDSGLEVNIPVDWDWVDKHTIRQRKS